MMLVIVHLVLSRTVMSFILRILTAPNWPLRKGALGIRVKLVPYIDVYIAEHPSWAAQSLPLWRKLSRNHTQTYMSQLLGVPKLCLTCPVQIAAGPKHNHSYFCLFSRRITCRDIGVAIAPLARVSSSGRAIWRVYMGDPVPRKFNQQNCYKYQSTCQYSFCAAERGYGRRNSACFESSSRTRATVKSILILIHSHNHGYHSQNHRLYSKTSNAPKRACS